MDTGILHAISSRKKMGVQFIVLGDRNQHPAIGDSFNGMPCDERSVLERGAEDRENNNWIKTMCDCNRLHLTEPKRCSATSVRSQRSKRVRTTIKWSLASAKKGEVANSCS